jgi:hypothetical protein
LLRACGGVVVAVQAVLTVLWKIVTATTLFSITGHAEIVDSVVAIAVSSVAVVIAQIVRVETLMESIKIVSILQMLKVVQMGDAWL